MAPEPSEGPLRVSLLTKNLRGRTWNPSNPCQFWKIDLEGKLPGRVSEGRGAFPPTQPPTPHSPPPALAATSVFGEYFAGTKGNRTPSTGTLPVFSSLRLLLVLQ